METSQLSVLDLPRDNVLGTLPRFKIVVPVKDLDAIAQLASLANEFLENPDSINSFPEISLEPITTHGYVEHYFVTGKNKKAYWYTRYVYQDISGKLRHHHIPKKQREAIFALWRSGASCQELCTGLGKTCKSK